MSSPPLSQPSVTTAPTEAAAQPMNLRLDIIFFTVQTSLPESPQGPGPRVRLCQLYLPCAQVERQVLGQPNDDDTPDTEGVYGLATVGAEFQSMNYFTIGL